MKQKYKVNPGFTLLEVLIAMAIVGILAGVGFTAYSVSFNKARDATRKNDLSVISRALEAYQSDFGVYPADQLERIAGCGNSNPGDQIDGTELCSWGGSWFLDNGKIYLRVIPRDLRDDYYFVYKASTDQKKYQLFAHLVNTNDPDIDNTLTAVCSNLGTLCNYGVASPNATINEVLQ